MFVCHDDFHFMDLGGKDDIHVVVYMLSHSITDGSWIPFCNLF